MPIFEVILHYQRRSVSASADTPSFESIIDWKGSDGESDTESHILHEQGFLSLGSMNHIRIVKTRCFYSSLLKFFYVLQAFISERTKFSGNYEGSWQSV